MLIPPTLESKISTCPENSLVQEGGRGREDKEGRWRKGVGMEEEGRGVYGRGGRREEVKEGAEKKRGVESKECFCRQNGLSDF